MNDVNVPLAEDTVRAVLHGLSFGVFLLGAVLLFIRMTLRYIRHRVYDPSRTPRALIRDLVFWAVLCTLLVIPAFAGVFGIIVGEHVGWVATRLVLGVIAIGTMLWYEFFIVGKENGGHGNGNSTDG